MAAHELLLIRHAESVWNAAGRWQGQEDPPLSERGQAQALALKPDADLSVATLAEDYAFGKDGIAAFKAALEGSGASVVAEEYVPQKTTDYTATIERLFNALKDRLEQTERRYRRLKGAVEVLLRRLREQGAIAAAA